MAGNRPSITVLEGAPRPETPRRRGPRGNTDQHVDNIHSYAEQVQALTAALGVLSKQNAALSSQNAALLAERDATPGSSGGSRAPAGRCTASDARRPRAAGPAVVRPAPPPTPVPAGEEPRDTQDRVKRLTDRLLSSGVAFDKLTQQRDNLLQNFHALHHSHQKLVREVHSLNKRLFDEQTECARLRTCARARDEPDSPSAPPDLVLDGPALPASSGRAMHVLSAAGLGTPAAVAGLLATVTALLPVGYRAPSPGGRPAAFSVSPLRRG